jgi:hydrocephalus-inducing protein
MSNKASAKWHDVYEVTPSRACIGRYGSLYVTVAFIPPAMQVYSAIFEAAVDGMTGVVSRYRSLTFDIQGDGNLPRVSIQRPATRNKAGNLIMLFKPLLVGRAQVLPLVLTNDGNLDADVKMTLTDPEKSFSISRTSLSQDDGIPKDNTPPKHITPNDILFRLPTSRSIEFAVQCKPTLTGKVIGEIRFTVRDNPYEQNALQLLGEGYKEDVTIDNIINGNGTRELGDGSNDRNGGYYTNVDGNFEWNSYKFIRLNQEQLRKRQCIKIPFEISIYKSFQLLNQITGENQPELY